MEIQKWQINETIYCQQLTAEYLEEALTFLEATFYPYENICSVMNLKDDPAALLELRDLTISAAKDGVTLIAIDSTTKKIVGAAFNAIQAKDNPVFENLSESWKTHKAKSIVAFMGYIDNICNLFDHCQVDCIFDFLFLSTSPEYKGRGIAKKLTEVSIELGTKLVNGINVKRSVDGAELSLEPVPKIISSIFTSFITQKIAKDLGFQIAAEKRYDELDFEGLDFGKIIETETTKLTLEYKKL